MRIEVTFSSGKFVAFPYVDKTSIEENNMFMKFKFGGIGTKHEASIRKSAIDFIETMPDED